MNRYADGMIAFRFITKNIRYSANKKRQIRKTCLKKNWKASRRSSSEY